MQPPSSACLNCVVMIYWMSVFPWMLWTPRGQESHLCSLSSLWVQGRLRGRRGLRRGTRGFGTGRHVALARNKIRTQEGKEEEKGSFECLLFHFSPEEAECQASPGWMTRPVLYFLSSTKIIKIIIIKKEGKKHVKETPQLPSNWEWLSHFISSKMKMS